MLSHGRSLMDQGEVVQRAFINDIQTVVPKFEVHKKFLEYAPNFLTEREQKLFQRLAPKAHITTRYSVLEPSELFAELDKAGEFKRGNFPSTSRRMQIYKENAFSLAVRALHPIFEKHDPSTFTHLVISSCTGFYAPGLDLQIQREFGMSPQLERTIVGFMGCYAAMNALKIANQAVLGNPKAKALVVNLELCTIHMQENYNLEGLLGFMQFADGCAISVVSSEAKGFELAEFYTDVANDAADLITWHVGDQGFEMFLSTEVPNALANHLPRMASKWLGADFNRDILWAVHPGGRGILDAVEDKLHLPKEKLAYSRKVLNDFGNMSSATVMFVLSQMLNDQSHGDGIAMAFGPGFTMEALKFKKLRH
jgi:alpha-pyrone synthase